MADRSRSDEPAKSASDNVPAQDSWGSTNKNTGNLKNWFLTILGTLFALLLFFIILGFAVGIILYMAIFLIVIIFIGMIMNFLNGSKK